MVSVNVASPILALAERIVLRTMVAMWASRRVKLIAGVPSASRRVCTLASAACERVAGATGSRARAASGLSASSINVSGAQAWIMCHCT